MINPCIPKISVIKASKRSTSVPWAVLCGPSAVGKTSFVNCIASHKISSCISKGIGENSQTTLIPCDLVVDERIERDDLFALEVFRGKMDQKQIVLIIQEKVWLCYSKSGYDSEETMECLDDEWFFQILEPIEQFYHLGRLKSELDFNKLKDIINFILLDLESGEESFIERHSRRKKELTGQKISAADIKWLVFEELWDTVSEEKMRALSAWLESVEILISKKLDGLLVNGEGNANEYSTEEGHTNSETGKVVPCGANILGELFDPKNPYSLIINRMSITCQPRSELLIYKLKKDIPFRFGLRDTVGFTQTGMDAASIRASLDAALNRKADSVLLMFNLEERSDVLAECCAAVVEKIEKAEKLAAPIYILFTKADKVVTTKVALKSKGKLLISQDDYDVHVTNAIDEIKNLVGEVTSKVPRQSVTWLSLRFLEEKLDPIQTALKDEQELCSHFTPEGLYGFVCCLANDIQRRILPAGLKEPVFVTADREDKPAIEISIDSSRLNEYTSRIKDALTKDVANINGYHITTNRTLNGRSVTTYWRKLQIGLGHTTNANVYGNFSINMKGLLNRVIRENINSFDEIYLKQAIATSTKNLNQNDVERLVKVFDSQSMFVIKAFEGINPELRLSMTLQEQNTQILHCAFRQFFISSGRYYAVMERVAYRLSYGNPKIQSVLVKHYNAPYSYDKTMRNLQEIFTKIFETAEFSIILCDEIALAMTELINKCFITI